MRARLRAGFVALALLLPAVAGARGVVVSPTQLGLVGAPGSTVSGVVIVASSRQQINNVRLSVGDFQRDEEGRLLGIDKSDHSRSCRSWVEVDQESFISPESGRVEVVVSARIPQDVSGSYWALLRIESLPPSRSDPGVMLGIIPRVTVPIIITVSGTEKLGIRIGQTVATQRKEGDVIDCYALIENTGNAAILVSGAFALERAVSGDEAPEELGVTDVGPVTSLPGTKMKIKGRVGWKGSARGLQIHGYFRYGPNVEDSAEAAATIEDESSTPRLPSPADRLAPPVRAAEQANPAAGSTTTLPAVQPEGSVPSAATGATSPPSEPAVSSLTGQPEVSIPSAPMVAAPPDEPAVDPSTVQPRVAVPAANAEVAAGEASPPGEPLATPSTVQPEVSVVPAAAGEVSSSSEPLATPSTVQPEVSVAPTAAQEASPTTEPAVSPLTGQPDVSVPPAAGEAGPPSEPAVPMTTVPQGASVSSTDVAEAALQGELALDPSTVQLQVAVPAAAAELAAPPIAPPSSPAAVRPEGSQPSSASGTASAPGNSPSTPSTDQKQPSTQGSSSAVAAGSSSPDSAKPSQPKRSRSKSKRTKKKSSS